MKDDHPLIPAVKDVIDAAEASLKALGVVNYFFFVAYPPENNAAALRGTLNNDCIMHIIEVVSQEDVHPLLRVLTHRAQTDPNVTCLALDDEGNATPQGPLAPFTRFVRL